MKRLLLGAVVFTMLAVACKKADDNSNTVSPAGSWKVGSHSYTALFTMGFTGGIIKDSDTYVVEAVDSIGTTFNAITFFFNGPSAPAPGAYKIVSRLTPPINGQVSFATIEGLGMPDSVVHLYLGNDNIYATVTDTGGKVRISLPDTWAVRITGKDSVKVSANITQTR